MSKGFRGFNEKWLKRYRERVQHGGTRRLHTETSKDQSNNGSATRIPQVLLGIARTVPTPKLNKTEAEYLLLLKTQLVSGHLLEILPHGSIKFRIGVLRCWYTPDFPAICADGTLSLHEVKGGFVRDDARVKFQSAKVQYPHFWWVWAQKKKSGWEIS